MPFENARYIPNYIIILFISMVTTSITLVFSVIVSAFCVSSAQRNYSNITQGSSLTPNQVSSWLSPSGVYAFGFYPQGNGYNVGIYIAKISEHTVVWSANRDNPPVNGDSTLLLTNEGKLVVKSPQGNYTTVIKDGPIYSASMLDSGNFVCYDSAKGEIWNSFSHPTDTILPGQSLIADQKLVSSASISNFSPGYFRLEMQTDGNLVQYPVDANNPYWASNTFGSNVSLNFDKSGHLYLMNSSINIQNLTDGLSSDSDSLFIMRIDVDGIFRTYSHTMDGKGNWSIEWESSYNKCDPKGLCGLNGFCVNIDEKIDCNCLPGFDFVSPGNWSAGCARNLTVDKCNDKSDPIQYNMLQLDHTTWEDVSYSVLTFDKKEDCSKSCFDDCNCEAALFNKGNCRKQRLPLRHGRREIQDPNTAFIKVGSFENDPIDPPKDKEDHTRNVILISSITLVVFSFIFLVASCFIVQNSRVWGYKKISRERNNELGEDVSLRSFTLMELEYITKGFGEELGKGSFGTVYKGVILQSHQVVAVKKLERALTEGEREFQTEIKVIGRTHHRNLVQLIGYCLEGSNRLLVYEYMDNGSLADLLLSPNNRPRWDERIAIALDIARGILYLHEECETPIIHCDIKPQNILMNKHLRAKIADFGLARFLKPDQTKTYTGIRGTRGYVAPEWHKLLPVTVKVDVYSFGIMLFEIICCRKSIDFSLSEEESVLEEWAYDCFEANQLNRLVGDEQVEMRKLERMVRVALWCIQEEPSLRPSMKKVMLMLEGTVEIPLPPSPNSFLSTI